MMVGANLKSVERAFKYIKSIIADCYILLFGGKGLYSVVARDTALVFPSELDEEKCNKLVDIIETQINNPNNKRVWKDVDGSDSRILGFEKDCPGSVDWLDVNNKIKNVERYTGRKVRSWFLMANKTVYQPGNKGSGGGYHRDSPYKNQLKIIWYLTDVNENNGPFQYVQRSNMKIHSKNRAVDVGVTRFKNNSFDNVVTVVGKSGTMLVCDTKCIHRGKPINEGKRYAITLYTSSNARSRNKRVVKL